jgi:hypothetical protein
MNFPQNNHVTPMNEFNAGGFAHVPPPDCLLPACVSVYVPANVEPLGAAGTNKPGDMVPVRPDAINCLVLFLGLII